MKIERRKSRVIKIGDCLIGGKNPIAIQSMIKTKASDIENTIVQAKQLEMAGCKIARLAIKDSKDASSLKEIKKAVKIPLVADIHFHYRLAIEAIENGADKVRLNPGNISNSYEIGEVVCALKASGIPLRIGLNSGSVGGAGLRKSSMADKLVAACMDYVKKIEKFKFDKIVISLKANNVLDTVEAYRKIARVCDYPLHLGVTATGSPYNGIIKSSVAIGSLLLEGCGDTIRVSLTDSPVKEVKAAECILESLGLYHPRVRLISCPTCGRCEVDLINIVKDLEDKLSVKEYGQSAVLAKGGRSLNVAVMGCVVNGPGEAREADLGVAFGKDKGILFSRGKIVRRIPAKDCVRILLAEIKRNISR